MFCAMFCYVLLCLNSQQLDTYVNFQILNGAYCTAMLISIYVSSLVIALLLLWRMEVCQKQSIAHSTSHCQNMIPLVSWLKKEKF